MKRRTVAVVVAALAAGMLHPSPAQAQRPAFKIRPVQKEHSVLGTKVAKDAPAPPADSQLKAWKAPPAFTWPAAATAEADLRAARAATREGAQAQQNAKDGAKKDGAEPDWRAVKAGDVPVSVAVTPTAGPAGPVGVAAPAGALAEGPGTARIDLASRQDAVKAGVDGLLLTIRPDKPGTLSVKVGYAAVRGAFGGDWASRMSLVTLPECALTSPGLPQCRTRTPLTTANDTSAATLTADVAASGVAVLAAVAGPKGANGAYTATSLAPSGTWSGGGNSGGFGYTYGIEVPQVPGELAPPVELNYSSSGVDGRVASTNNQPSWLGEGWEYEPGYIERSYQGCADDQGNGANNTTKTGDLCWKSDNATLSLNGTATALVRDDASGTWRLAADDGSRVEHLNGTPADTANGDADNEYWRITKPDGTQYWFGKNRLPGWSAGRPETGSAYTVPVYGNHPAEPCHAAAYADSSCVQPWRWQLDYVVDPHGNAMAYYYDRQTNSYARGGSATANTDYVRAGHLNRIEYGLRSSDVYATAPAKVSFGVSERCLSGCDTFDAQHAANWPDVPVDQNCAQGARCTTISPTFWTRKRLTSITTQVGGKVVDSWALTQDFPGTGDNTAAGLWLSRIARTASGTGDSVTLPATTFSGTLMENRVDADEGRPPLNKYRITRIGSDTGADALVTYSAKECVYGATPDPASNTKRCHPSWWTPEGYTEPVKDWFHKYVVTQVVEDDKVAGSGSESVVTSYEYLGGAAWVKDDSEFVLDKHRTYSQFRGYQTVRTKVGATARSQTDTVYLRGLGATVPDSEGNQVSDDPALAGATLETLTYTGETGALASASVTEPWLSPVTATRAVKDRPALTARQIGTSVKRSRTLITTATGTAWRRTRAGYTHGDLGQVLSSEDQGDTAVSGDENCVTTAYTARDTANWLVSYPSAVKTTAGTCAAPGATLSETRTFYDGQALGAAPKPGQGNVTRTETLDHFDGASAVYAATTAGFDAYGRATSATDELGHTTTTAYSPATGIPTGTTITDPKGFTTTAVLDGIRGLTLSATDANGRTAFTDYDAVGRLTAVWLPGHAKNSAADLTYTYAISATAPTAVTHRSLLDDGSYRTSITLYDGLLRERQTQQEAHGGGRLISDSFLDSHGRTWKANAAYWNAQAPGAELFGVPDNQVPSQTVTEFDGQDRETAEIFKSLNVEKWRGTTSYGGNYTAVVPPEGAAATLTLTDVRGRTTELRQYPDRNPAFTATKYDATAYGYDQKGQLQKVVDPAGNTWTYSYDLRGRRTTLADPDIGTTRWTYDAAGHRTGTTDARGVTLAYAYDELGRKTSVSQGGGKLAEWAYDTLPGGKGLLASSTRYDNGNAYVNAVKGYDGAGRTTGSTVTIPQAEGLLAGTYTIGTTYKPNTGLVASTSYQAAGGLPAETVRPTYTRFGKTASLDNGSRLYVSGTQYSPYEEVLQTVLGDVGTRVVHTMVYEDATRRLGQVFNDRERTGPQTIDNTVFAYNAVGDVTSVRDDRDDKTSVDTQCYAYDHRRRLTEAWTATDDCAAAPSAATVGGPAPYWQTFTFDVVGNRTKEVQHATTGDVTRTYTYPAAGGPQPHTLLKVDTAGGRTDTFEYDATGNTKRRVTALGDQAMTWNAEGDLASSTVAGRVSAFVYDADGNRIIRRDPGSVTLYLDGQELTLGGGKVTGTRYYEGPQATVVRTGDGKVNYLLGDHHDTEELVVNATTLAYTRRSTTPYGGARGTVPASWPGQRGFVGGIADDSTGLTHLGAREYDVATGRFVSADPVMDLSDPQQINGYAYASNNPVAWSDPSGLRVCFDDECRRDGIRPDGTPLPTAPPATGSTPLLSGRSTDVAASRSGSRTTVGSGNGTGQSSGGTGYSGGGSTTTTNPGQCTSQSCILQFTDPAASKRLTELMAENKRLSDALAEEQAKLRKAQQELEQAKKKKKQSWWDRWGRTAAAIGVGVIGAVAVGACGVTLVCGIVAGAAVGMASYSVQNAGSSRFNLTGLAFAGLTGAALGTAGRYLKAGQELAKAQAGVKLPMGTEVLRGARNMVTQPKATWSFTNWFKFHKP
ncbi:RHS repeat-associated core domain-containing protein [Streptosporangium sp. NPDC051023]|uniref:RHS repeat-associated core domain-containing protein n=1 Tax=Streptosporangium sp. NPDC051023 TaxID=3155410 RepID=UPI00344D44D2